MFMRLTFPVLRRYGARMDERAIYGTLGEAVLVRRKRLGLTQAQVAKKVGISRESLANIEAGRQRVLLHHVYGLMRALDLKFITDLIPAAPPRVSNEAAMSVSVSGAAVTDKEMVSIESLINQAMGERSVGSSS